jgi:hypothetical protein
MSPVPSAHRRPLSFDEGLLLWSRGEIRCFILTGRDGRGVRYRVCRTAGRCPREGEVPWHELFNAVRRHRIYDGRAHLNPDDPKDPPDLEIVCDDRDPSYASVAWTRSGYRRFRTLILGWSRTLGTTPPSRRKRGPRRRA